MTIDCRLTPERFEEITIVSRETMDRLRIYAAYLKDWQQTLNLISRNSVLDLWDRHMRDSIQLVEHLPDDARSITDIGSGAGFPGLVLAIVTGLPTELIESHARKGTFLREVASATKAPVTVTTARVEDIAREKVLQRQESAKTSIDILTVRALAPLEKLCEMADSLGAKRCLFMKGRRWREELTDAEKRWRIQHQSFESVTSPEGRILRVTGLKKR